jgi:hypothetical protein
MYSGSLAVEGRPSRDNRPACAVGSCGATYCSLEHIGDYLDGGRNHLVNLGWACLWCNIHLEARIPLATDHGGFYPVERRYS